MSTAQSSGWLSQAVTGLLERLGSPPREPTHFPDAQQTSALLSLPDDILLLIFALIKEDDLLACKQVCRSLSRLLQVDLRCQYRIELAANGMIDGPSSDVTLPDRLEQLHEHRARLASTPFSVDEGAWATAEGRVQVLASDGTVVYAMRRTQGGYNLDIRTPPGPSAQVEAGVVSGSYCLTVEMGPDSHIETVDTSQNLLVVSESINDSWEITIHLLDMTTGLPHSAASGAVLRTVSDQGRPFLVQVHRQYLAWLVWAPGLTRRDIEIWDWQAGRIVWRHTFRPQTSFAFLNTSYILTTSGRQEVIEVFRFDDHTHDPNQDVDSKPFLTMELPLGAFRCSIHHDERSRIHTSSSSSSGAPFRPDPLVSVVAVRFAIYATSTELANALLLVPRATFHEQIDAALNSSDSEPERRMFWHEWGPTGGLLLNLSGPEIIPRVVFSPCGSRFPVLVRDKWKAGQAQIVVFDVNPWAARAARCKNGSKAGGSLTVIKDTSSFRFRTLRASIPHVAYLGPRMSFPKEHKPTFVTMNHDGFTVQHEWKPPYQERLGFGYQTFYI
ncbi:hypothetical protein GSI_13488 [Ganoderma sinense ZZ0214-1]|uniref:F-box domain-containing protein n=1 Tax=Ganoderma sinense ZZ0214-1 TaxID=1077348 RepID=A0A2G8RQX6_9APHY|nr:hypothetical protein GSI_13488 [Ganoderma sinense ZZ0214-1]